MNRVLGWLAAALLGFPAAAQPASFGEVRVAGLSFLRGTLPPPDAGALDGLGTAQDCPRPTAPLDQLLYDHLLDEGAALSCGNRFENLLHFPGDEPSGSGSYPALADQIRGARREVLIANMVWDGGQNAPGTLLAQALADLHRRVRAHPEAYPQGLTVRLLLGNSVRFDSPLDPTANVFNAARDLLDAGLSLNGAPEPGWKLEVANYRYAFPHSHMKLLVVDGDDVTTGGFNISTMHLPASTPGGQALADLGLRVRGPVARQAAAAFRDAWQSSRELSCTANAAAATVRQDCHLGGPAPAYPLVWFGPPEKAGEARVYGLYRRNGFPAGDTALTALFGAAQTRIDLLQSQVSGDLTCDLSLTTPGGCPLAQHGLPVWQAIVGAIRERHVHVRLVLDQTPVLQVEALTLLGSVQAELRSLGLQDCLEARWAGHRLHTKAAIIDGAMTVVGSTNLHFSSFGPGGLTEYDLATSDPAAVGAVQATFEDEWRQARPVTLPWWLRP
ncbi:phospholipase D-like domain-containing protein [Deinococcus metallilatus]|uniref:Cardiolipin synthase n=1 Tax=Deinococcus metallilatus TaxID=1211322 RepID=A0ABR6N015_9DEIO|nr:phospholipase D-like domain-containing protein [Deinococcus metallilatus]MBB5296965.1 cardiolipin synthase [Deinococcus metallilatus]